jgi:ribosomal protein L37AE/L43A
VKGSVSTSRLHTKVCPFCGTGVLRPTGGIRCDLCGRAVEDAVLKTLEQIASLPDALGNHACECGHPEMRRLPDRVFHCPACGSEVISAARPQPETVTFDAKASRKLGTINSRNTGST